MNHRLITYKPYLTIISHCSCTIYPTPGPSFRDQLADLAKEQSSRFNGAPGAGPANVQTAQDLSKKVGFPGGADFLGGRSVS